MSNKKNNTIIISKKFKNTPSPNFQITLTTNISNKNFQLKYYITNTLKHNNKKKNNLQLTQFTIIKQHKY